MEVTIHPLQKKSAKLLKDLYHERNLGLTRGMLTIENGHYPHVSDILWTLKHYEKEDMVSQFVSENYSLIENTKKEEQTRKIEEQKNRNKHGFDEFCDFSDDVDSGFKSVDGYSALKKVSIADIENSLSDELSKLCGDELLVEVDSLSGKPNNSNAEMKIVVKGKIGFF